MFWIESHYPKAAVPVAQRPVRSFISDGEAQASGVRTDSMGLRPQAVTS